MRHKITLFIRVILGLILFFGIERFCHKQTRGFSLLKIASNSPLSSDDEIYSLTLEQKSELDAIFDQSFSFLNSGGQCYAFLSDDGKTVIKFFKHHHIRMWNFLNGLPLPRMFHASLKKLLEEKKHQSPQFFESCKIAYEHFKDRSGLLYLHIHKTRCFNKKLKIIDKLGINHLIDLDSTDFALQKRAELSHQKFRTLIKENNLDIAKECIDSILSLIRERCQKGINDRDPNMRRNIGFLNTMAVEIDLGSFTREEPVNDPDCIKEELSKRTGKFRRWLSKHDERLTPYLDQKIIEFGIQSEF